VVQPAQVTSGTSRAAAPTAVVVDGNLSVDDTAAITAKVKAALANHVPVFGGAVVSVVPARGGAL
jgi:divalent metal cation (Fe/Co/Zn/Cd) transporter